LISALNPKIALKTEHYEKAFDYFDIDHSGGISYEEVAKFLEGQESQEAIKDIFCEIDINGDGNISR
jgi:Ca2+-binding EF-hand superfamily protein